MDELGLLEEKKLCRRKNGLLHDIAYLEVDGLGGGRLKATGREAAGSIASLTCKLKLLEAWMARRFSKGSGGCDQTESVREASQEAKVRVAKEGGETVGCSTTVASGSKWQQMELRRLLTNGSTAHPCG